MFTVFAVGFMLLGMVAFATFGEWYFGNSLYRFRYLGGPVLIVVGIALSLVVSHALVGHAILFADPDTLLHRTALIEPDPFTPLALLGTLAPALSFTGGALLLSAFFHRLRTQHTSATRSI
jgi:hypothetical protein